MYPAIFAADPEKSPAMALKEHLIEGIQKNMDQYKTKIVGQPTNAL